MSRHRLRADAVRGKAREVGDSTDYAIARRVGLRQSTISRLLTGRTTPSVGTLLALRAAYGLPLDDLIEGPADLTAAAHAECVAVPA